jgi:RNA polymerase sigma-70 factor (ECF subfamily)
LEDHNAFGELVRRYQSPVRAFLAKMARGDTHLADDMAQETFLKAWKHLATFRNEAKFSTWLFGIAFNEFPSQARRNR